MKKYFILFLILCGAAFIYLSYSLPPEKKSAGIKKKGFVSIEKKKFKLNNKDFIPITLNYMVSVQSDSVNLWPSAFIGYNGEQSGHLYTTQDSCLMQLKADMELIKEMGFNSVRLVAIGEESVSGKENSGLHIDANVGNKKILSFPLNSDSNYQKYFKALEMLFDIVNKTGLKIVFLVRTLPDVEATEIHVRKVAEHFKNDTAIMAFDLFNEPLYFDLKERTKEDVYFITKRWRRIFNTYAPNHLITIGLTGIREVFEWDPNILDVDFLSMHPYEYGPDQVMNEIYWYGSCIKKPWIIGETGLSADNDSVTYETQKKFADRTIKQAFSCGAIGYSWWQYKDVQWFNYQPNFLGLLNWKGEIKKNNIVIKGSLKPVAEAFKNIDPLKKEDCLFLPNYYNYSNFKTFRLTGHLFDDDNEPINGGVILAWNEHWSKSYHTVTKPDGSFELLSNFPLYHWMASATMHSRVRGDLEPDKVKPDNNIPTLSIGKLKISKLKLID